MKTKFWLIQVHTKITNLGHNFGEGKIKKCRKQFGIDLNIQFSQFCCQYLGQEKQIGDQKSVKGCSNVSGTNWRNSPPKLREIGSFSCFSPIFHPALSKTMHSPS